jgi:plastocyanin
MHRTTLLLPIAIARVCAPLAQAADYEVTQKNKAFSAKKLKVKVGDKVNFKNEDAFLHNVFSSTTCSRSPIPRTLTSGPIRRGSPRP